MKILVPKSKNQILAFVFCLFILLMPVELIHVTSFYSVETPSSIWYKYRSFEYSFFALILIILAIIKRKKSNAIRFERIILSIIIKDIILFFLGTNNTGIPFDFSLYFVLFISWALVTVVMSNKSISSSTFIDTYFVLAIVTMIVRIVFRMSTGGRYGAIGLSVGGTGFFAGLYIIYLLYVREYSKKVLFYILLAAFALIVSGQRTNLFICMLLCLPYFFQRKRENQENKSKFLLLSSLVGIVIFALCVLSILTDVGIQIQGFEYITRVFEAIELLANGGLGGEFSVAGRLKSTNIAFEILNNNPLGISNVFYDLQYRMIRLGFPTFPHSTIISCFLLWSIPIVLYCEIWIIRDAVKLWKGKHGFFWVILYIQVLMFIWGSPFLDYPLLFILLFFLSMAHNTTNCLSISNNNT